MRGTHLYMYKVAKQVGEQMYLKARATKKDMTILDARTGTIYYSKALVSMSQRNLHSLSWRIQVESMSQPNKISYQIPEFPSSICVQSN